MTVGLLSLADWLSSQNITHVAMESTGEFWKPVYNLLEGNFEVLVVNAQHVKNVPGRKTDVQDAEWIAQLLRHGLLRGSFIPPLPQRDLRDLTRQRTNLVRERATVVNRLQKVLEWANLKLAAVVTDVAGVSARQMLAAILEGEENTQVLAELAKGRMRHKRQELEQALSGRVREHHRFLLSNHLTHLDFLEEQIAIFNSKIDEYIQASPPKNESQIPISEPQTQPAASTNSPSWTLNWQQSLALLDTIPGVSRQTAELLLAEVGSDMSRFPTAAHLARWARLCPGNHESAGKRYSGKTGSANNWLRSGLIQAAHAAVKCKKTYLYAVYRRLAPRRGKKRAIVAVAHRMLIAAYQILLKQEPYQDLGHQYLDERRQENLVKRLSHRMRQLGYNVVLEPLSTT
jgi:transposase